MRDPRRQLILRPDICLCALRQPSRLALLEARADALDAAIDKAVDGPAEKLGQRAAALCPRLSYLQQLQQQFQFRLSDGEPLQRINANMDRADKASCAQR